MCTCAAAVIARVNSHDAYHLVGNLRVALFAWLGGIACYMCFTCTLIKCIKCYHCCSSVQLQQCDWINAKYDGAMQIICT